MEKQNMGKPLEIEPEGTTTKFTYTTRRPASSNGGMGCPKCKWGELVRRVDEGTGLYVFECQNPECGYFED